MKLIAFVLATMSLVSPTPAEGSFEKDLFDLHNQIRQDPSSFIPELENILADFAGTRFRKLQIGDKTYNIATLEADVPVRELITFLRKQPRLQPLTYDDSLQGYACQHVNDQGSTRDTGHQSSAGDSWNVRIANLRTDGHALGENLTYGVMGARDALLTLAINDGVRSRAHRLNIFNEDFQKIGLCKGDHAAFTNMVDVIFKGEEGSGAAWAEAQAQQAAEDLALRRQEIDNANALKATYDENGKLNAGSPCGVNAASGLRPDCAAGLCCGAGLKTGAAWTTQIESCQADTTKTFEY